MYKTKTYQRGFKKDDKLKSKIKTVKTFRSKDKTGNKITNPVLIATVKN